MERHNAAMENPIDAQGISLEAKVAALRNPEVYPGSGFAVEAIETHCAWVFLAGEHAYKLKKPMRLDRMDNLSLSSRLRNCLEEVTLNRRLAPHVYLDVIALRSDAHGRLSFGDDGIPVEWLVRMRRLPRELLLDRAIAEHRVTDEAIDRAAELLADFYAGQVPETMGAAQYLDRIKQRVDQNHRALLDPRFELPRRAVHDALAPQYAFLKENAALLEERARAKRIVEGHGDLKPEHIFIGSPPCIIDCLEFDRDLRVIDPLEELCALRIECERLGARIIADRLLAVYADRCNDPPSRSLSGFYEGRRATQRALTACWHLLDERVAHAKDWRGIALSYLWRAAAAQAPGGLYRPASSESEPPVSSRRMASANKGAALKICSRLPT